MSNKIKAVNIIGHNVNSKNNLPGVVTIGNKENGVTLEELKSVDSDQDTLTEDYYNDLFSHDSVGEDADHTDEL